MDVDTKSLQQKWDGSGKKNEQEDYNVNEEKCEPERGKVCLSIKSNYHFL